MKGGIEEGLGQERFDQNTLLTWSFTLTRCMRCGGGEKGISSKQFLFTSRSYDNIYTPVLAFFFIRSEIGEIDVEKNEMERGR